MKTKRVRKLGWGILILFLLVGATPGLAQAPFLNQPLVPAATVAGGSGFTLTVNGAGFVSGSVVSWNGSALTTTFVNHNRLAATVSSADIATPGTAWVTVSNGGVRSNVGYFEITNPTTSVSFKKTNFGVGSEPTSVAVGDFNGDGVLDLAVANYGSNNVSVLLGNGDGTFSPLENPGSNVVGTHPQGVAVGDFNGDGKLDLAVANRDSKNLSVLLGNGDGTFQAAVNYAVGTYPYAVAVGDFNGDGKLDLAVANVGSGNVSVLLGNGDGTFQAAVNYLTGDVNPSSVAVGDFDGDGKLDLAVANSGGRTVSVLLGNGDGTFQAAVGYTIGSGPSSVAVGDFNGDGKLDLAVANGNLSSLSVLLGNGDGTFQAPAYYALGLTPWSVAVGDFNGDGKLDLAVANYGSKNVSVLFGDGGGAFQAAVNYAVGTTVYSVAVGDFDGDGRMDLAVTNYGSTNVSILQQSAPTGGSAQLVGGNAFIGNQTVNGKVTATSFFGDGSGLTGVNAATVANGVYTTGSYADPSWITSLSGTKITGTVASAATAATASNATALGGVAARSYARADIGNHFTGNQSFAGNIGIGTTSPQAAFDLAGSTGHLLLPSSGAQLQFTRASACYIQTSSPDGYLDFVVNGRTNSDLNASLKLAANGDAYFQLGKVGIGTANPGEKLDVAGNLRSSGNVKVTGGDVSTTMAGSGLIVKSPDGTKCARIGIDNNGAIVATNVTCP